VEPSLFNKRLSNQKVKPSLFNEWQKNEKMKPSLFNEGLPKQKGSCYHSMKGRPIKK